MSLRRVSILLGKEFSQSLKNFMFVYAIVVPVVLSLVVTLVFGALFSEKPKLGIADMGDSGLTAMAKELPSVVTKEFGAVIDVTRAAESGAVDMGIVLPEDFDSSVMQGKEVQITAYVWGESLAKNRTILRATIANLARELAGQEAPVEIETSTLGDEVSIPWNDRILPFIVLMTVIIGGTGMSAVSVVNEKEKNTLEALVITPTSIGDVLVAKGLMGILLSLFMGIVILVLNQAMGAEPTLLVLLLGLGSIMAAVFGLILGASVKDVTTLFAAMKLIGILLYVPALIYLFPQIPQWIGRAFPTYYLVQPIVEISQRGGGWPDIATDVFILVLVDLALIAVLMVVLRKVRQFAV